MERLPYYQVLHILSLLVLTAHTFMALANPAPENRKRTMIITGSAALVMLICGFAMVSVNKIPFSSGWLITKMICWLGFTALAGIAYRKVHLRRALSLTGMLLLGVAVSMVYFRPF